MKLTCIVIDDDIYAVNGIKSYINKLANFHLIKSYTDPLEALNEVTAGDNVDIIFIDVDMPVISGLELSKSIRHKADKLIFTTSHSKYAYEAFELNASAYLLKPYTFARFAETINRLFPLSPALPHVNIKQEDDYFFVRNKNQKNSLIKVRYADIVVIESLQNYVRIFTLSETIVSYIALSEIKIILKDHQNFAQAHRSFIIAKNYIEKVEGNTLRMINDLTINIGNSYRESIQEYIKEKTIKTNRS